MGQSFRDGGSRFYYWLSFQHVAESDACSRRRRIFSHSFIPKTGEILQDFLGSNFTIEERWNVTERIGLLTILLYAVVTLSCSTYCSSQECSRRNRRKQIQMYCKYWTLVFLCSKCDSENYVYVTQSSALTIAG